MSPLPFLTDLAAPLVELVGDEWEAGRLEIRHEHFLSERLADVLRLYRMPFEERAWGPLVVFATLPGEAHALGLQMASVVVAQAGCRVCYVGTEVPVDELATVGVDLAARAVAVSVSVASKGARSAAMLARLRARLPRRTALVAGGRGAPAGHAAVITMSGFADLETWARTFAGMVG
jgi:methanogenic corrinoid protein MtbC1